MQRSTEASAVVKVMSRCKREGLSPINAPAAANWQHNATVGHIVTGEEADATLAILENMAVLTRNQWRLLVRRCGAVYVHVRWVQMGKIRLKFKDEFVKNI